MKLGRRKFEYIKEKHILKYKLFKIKEDKYIYLYSFKTFLLSIYKVIEIIALFPVGIIMTLLDAIWQCILDFPDYIKEFLTRVRDLCPIKYIKIVDDDIVVKSHPKGQYHFDKIN